MHGELREEPDEAVRHGFRRRLGGGLEQVDHRAGGHSGGSIRDEPTALREVAAHVQQPAQRFGLHGGDEHRRSAAKLLRFRAAGRSQLLGNLQQVADDDLVVGFDPLVLVDGARNDGGLRRQRSAFGITPAIKRRARKAHPERRKLCRRRPRARGRVVHHLDAVERQRVEPDVRPLVAVLSPIAERASAAIGVFGDGLDDERQLLLREAARELDNREVMAVQALGQALQHGVACIRGDAFDDKPVARHADRDVRAITEQALGAAGQSVERGLQRRVTIRVHPVAVQGDRQILQELAQLAGERLLLGRRRLCRRGGRQDGRGIVRERRGGLRVHAFLLSVAEPAVCTSIARNCRPSPGRCQDGG